MRFLDPTFGEVPRVAIILVAGDTGSAIRVGQGRRTVGTTRSPGFKVLDRGANVDHFRQSLVPDNQVVLARRRSAVLERADLLVRPANANVQHSRPLRRRAQTRRGRSTSMTLTSLGPGKTASAFISAWIYLAFMVRSRRSPGSGWPLGKYVTRAARRTMPQTSGAIGSLFVRALGRGELQRLRHGMSGRILDRRRGHEPGVRHHIGRKNSPNAQSLTTPSRREAPGTWARWTPRAASQPRRPRKRMPLMSAIPSFRPKVATCPSDRKL